MLFELIPNFKPVTAIGYTWKDSPELTKDTLFQHGKTLFFCDSPFNWEPPSTVVQSLYVFKYHIKRPLVLLNSCLSFEESLDKYVDLINSGENPLEIDAVIYAPDARQSFHNVRQGALFYLDEEKNPIEWVSEPIDSGDHYRNFHPRFFDIINYDIDDPEIIATYVKVSGDVSPSRTKEKLDLLTKINDYRKSKGLPPIPDLR